MKRNRITTASIFRRLGSVEWSLKDDAFVIQTKRGARLLLSPNSDEGSPTRVHIDEIEVPEVLRRRGVANAALVALCKLADKYRFHLEGGPVGWSDHPWREKHLLWLRRLGFTADTKMVDTQIDDPNAFYVARPPMRQMRSQRAHAS